MGKSARQVKQMLADVDPELAVPADRVRALSAGRWELKAVIDDDCRRGLEQLKGLLSHVDPQMTLGQLVGRLVKEGLDRHDPSRPPRRRRTGGRTADAEVTWTAKKEANPNRSAPARAQASAPPAEDATLDGSPPSTPKPQAQQADHGTSPAKTEPYPARPTTSTAIAPGEVTSTAKSARRAIPAPVKRRVWLRDGGRCRYVDRKTGRRCNSRHLLQIDHVLPFALGGGAEPENLRLLCGAHHRYRHAG